MKSEVDVLVSAMLDHRLTDQQADRLSELLASSPDAVRQYLDLLDNHEALCSIYPGEVYSEGLDRDANELQRDQGENRPSRWRAIPWMFLVLAASLAAVVGLSGYFLGVGRGLATQGVAQSASATGRNEAREQTLAGHAMLRRSVDLKWANPEVSYRDGDVISGGVFEIVQGIAEIDFFSGATLTVEGPASLNIESDWIVRVNQGRLRANVPPAARGFVVQAIDSDIIDLGTEFAMDVSKDHARVTVIDGEVALSGGPHDGQHLTTGQHQWLGNTQDQWLGNTQAESEIKEASDLDGLQQRRLEAEQAKFMEWKSFSQETRQDPRLIAYYPITGAAEGRELLNQAPSVGTRNGIRVGPVQRSEGRFGARSRGLDFERIGARVRTRIDGEYTAMTFTTWVRIDRLQNRYNSLFMGDGYENGEPHWQIRDDGRLMFSVMIDDSADIRVRNDFDSTSVRDAGLHHVYFSPPIWDISKSGRWFHLAAVYDPSQRRVTQYVDGNVVSVEAIQDKFFTPKLRIGASEIGNWGQPFRKTRWFAVRNLDGTIDELSIYDTALTDDEVFDLYQRGKPLGY